MTADNVIEIIRIIGGSWPIAALVVGIAGAVMIRGVVKNINRRAIEEKRLQTEANLEISRFQRKQGAITTKDNG